jgi:hypothetical protein
MLRGTSRRTINRKKRRERINEEAKRLIINVNSPQLISDNEISVESNFESLPLSLNHGIHLNKFLF